MTGTVARACGAVPSPPLSETGGSATRPPARTGPRVQGRSPKRRRRPGKPVPAYGPIPNGESTDD
jgi:hypothetical protein